MTLPAVVAEPSPSRLVVVAGSGRSGTSTIAGVLKLLGLLVPQPEIPAKKSNPRGHFEPAWVVEFQSRQLARAQVRLSDARPEAFGRTAKVGARPKVQAELGRWLADVLAQGPEVVVKDPRNSWFVPMWREGAAVVGGLPRFLTMLRHPAEVVGSKGTYYFRGQSGDARRAGDISRLASWVNVALFSEYSTRDSPRVFVRYVDLVADWRSAVSSVGEALDLSLRHGVDPDAARAVDDFIDPDLHRVRVTWDDVDLPVALCEIAEETWQLLGQLADLRGRDASVEAELDRARECYQMMYANAAAMTQSSVNAAVAAQQRRQRNGRGESG